MSILGLSLSGRALALLAVGQGAVRTVRANTFPTLYGPNSAPDPARNKKLTKPESFGHTRPVTFWLSMG